METWRCVLQKNREPSLIGALKTVSHSYPLPPTLLKACHTCVCNLVAAINELKKQTIYLEYIHSTHQGSSYIWYGGRRPRETWPVQYVGYLHTWSQSTARCSHVHAQSLHSMLPAVSVMNNIFNAFCVNCIKQNFLTVKHSISKFPMQIMIMMN